MAGTFKVGISGGGVIARVHAGAMQEVEEADLVAVAEPRMDAGKAFAEDFGVTHYASLDEMLAQEDLDAVIVATPSGMHPDQVVQVAQAGKHVITEKPMAITAEGATRMIDACEQAGVRLAVIFQTRLSADVVRVKRALEAGVFGTPVLANGSMYWHRSQEYYDANGGWRGTWELDGGGALMNQAIHTLDILQWLMGGVKEIKSFADTLTHEIDTEDVAAAAFRFNNGALGTITATTSCPTDSPVRIEVIGTKGRVTLETAAITRWDAEQQPEDIAFTEKDEELVGGWEAGEAFGKAHARQLRTIFRSIRDGEQPPVPGNEARVAVDTILGIYEDAGIRAG